MFITCKHCKKMRKISTTFLDERGGWWGVSLEVVSVVESWVSHVSQSVVSIDAIVSYRAESGVQNVGAVIAVDQSRVRFTLLSKKKNFFSFRKMLSQTCHFEMRAKYLLATSSKVFKNSALAAATSGVSTTGSGATPS